MGIHKYQGNWAQAAYRQFVNDEYSARLENFVISSIQCMFWQSKFSLLLFSSVFSSVNIYPFTTTLQTAEGQGEAEALSELAAEMNIPAHSRADRDHRPQNKWLT